MVASFRLSGDLTLTRLAYECSDRMNFSKSKLLAFRQCEKRLWLEIHRPDVCDEPSVAEGRLDVGRVVGELARKLYDPDRAGVLIDARSEGFESALSRSISLLNSSKPIFEAGFAAGGAIAFADMMLPAGSKSKPLWRMVEVKSSASVKDYQRDDIAIQAFVASSAGAVLKSVAIAHIDSKWVYPGEEKYKGLLTEEDVTDEVLGRRDEIVTWIKDARSVAEAKEEPAIRMGAHCSNPFDCNFNSYCHGQTKRPKHPVDWLPRLQGKVIKEFIEKKQITDMRKVPDKHLNDIQLRVKASTLSGKPFFDKKGAAKELAQYKLPAYFLDFETINFAIPIWKGVRPYQQIPFQFSIHAVSKDGELCQSDFLDLSGEDPSKPLAEALISSCQSSGPIFSYNAGFETSRIKELAVRFSKLRKPLLKIVTRVVDLMPIARRHYYHPSQEGSWSIKRVLPSVAEDLNYGTLEGVQDGSSAMGAYTEAINCQTTEARKEEIRSQLAAYCRLDTLALVRLWQAFSGL